MEQFGWHKRDILVDRVKGGREAQQDAQKQFQTTFEAFKQITGISGGKLEETYNKLKKEHDRSESAANAVASKIQSIDKVANDLFAEWTAEIETYQSAEFKQKSRQMLDETRGRFEKLIAAMRAAQARMQPILVKFNDHVLFLKHNLNAQAIHSLQDTVIKIGADVDLLVGDMQKSIAEADAFIASMSSGDR